jgi:hypothetical protein
MDDVEILTAMTADYLDLSKAADLPEDGRQFFLAATRLMEALELISPFFGTEQPELPRASVN